MEFGTGALGVTPAHSAVDWQMGETNSLPIVKVIDEDGRIHKGFGEFSGHSAQEAREMIIDRLSSKGLIEKKEEIGNNLSLCYRCDTPIEPLPSLQWFIDVNKPIDRLGNRSLKEVSLQAVKEGVFGQEKIRIIPERFEKTYYNWMENLRDWCISRQIWFGHQVPVWYRGDETYVGIDEPVGEGWTRDEDTLDTWFSSGLWTFSTLAHSPEDIKIENGKLSIDSDDFRRFHPTQVLETGYDILFFWVARMIIMTTYAIEDIPFENVYLHGLILDDKGKKMSKSKDNAIDPLDMCDRYGTDATRLSLIIGSTPGNDMRLSEEKIAGFRNLINKLWNVSRYIKQSVSLDMSEDQTIDYDKLTSADRWILAELDRLIADTGEHLDNYRFSEAGEGLREFTWNILADWYIEASKFLSGEETEKVLVHTLRNLLRLWHPYIPFVTEKIWSELGSQNLIIEKWPVREEASRLSGTDDFSMVKEMVVAIRNARSENKIEPSRRLEALIYSQDQDLIRANESLLKSLRTGLESITVKANGPKPDQAIYAAVGNTEIYLLGAIDQEKEAARLKDEIDKLEAYIGLIKQKLANDEFRNNAPRLIVEKEEAKLAEAETKKQKLEEQLASL